MHKRWINYTNLFQELNNDETMFFRYTRMSNQSIERLLQLLQPHLMKQNYRALGEFFNSA